MTANLETEIVTCDLCGSSNYEQILVGSDMLHGFGGQWSVVRCSVCNLCFTNPRPTIKSLAEVYPSDYKPYTPGKEKNNPIRFKLMLWAMRNHWGYPGDKSLVGKLLSAPYMIWLRNKAANFGFFRYEGQGRLLDYGCGNGSYISKMQRFGWNVIGMDMSEEAVKVCKMRNVETYVGVNPAEKFDPESFEVVTLWHVLEHVPSPSQTLKQIHQVLKPGGKLIMALPNIDSWLFKWLGKYWFPLDLPRHLTHFSKNTVTLILRNNGFDVENIYAQRHGQITQKSVKNIARATQGTFNKILSKSRLACSFIETLAIMTGSSPRIVVHAMKK